jgi:GT2 family glycosyltransferase
VGQWYEMTPPKVTIIILNWNGKEDTIECLESLKHITYPNYEILLVDNGSTDGSVECFRERYPEIEIIENGENLGFAEGNNVGIQRAMDKSADYVLLLNNDTVVDPEFLGELVKVAENNEKIWIVGPKIYYYFYEGRKDVIWFAGGKILRNFGQPFHSGLHKIDKGQYDKLKNVDFISGCASLIKMEAIKQIGLLDTDYFAYFEDLDFNINVSKAGYKIVYSPNSKIWHKASSTSGFMSPMYIYFHTRNRILFVRKNSNDFNFLFLFLPYFFIIRIIIPFFMFAIKNRWDNISALVDGIKHGVTMNLKK